ncbi:uncharacterized protein LOC131675688 isoform X2 [Phymastichus coffea]|uniref:uncharacterized protein LOC131675688 isoform X2 n=1 Tax=Phymastichus coffea TaxID=108790 RepID=UPI00273BF7E6|nr:uncharacterized protein LOC131675688 isoform X2 [Phymastichus coffea]
MPGYKWVHMSAGMPVPESAVVGGMDIDGATIYVGRALHDGDMLPAKVIPEKNVAYVCHGGHEIAKHVFEVLTKSDFHWVFASSGHIPPNAVIAGQTQDGEPLYVGRAMHEGSQTIGKVQQSHGCLYIPFDGQEISHRDYEVLVMH